LTSLVTGQKLCGKVRSNEFLNRTTPFELHNQLSRCCGCQLDIPGWTSIQQAHPWLPPGMKGTITTAHSQMRRWTKIRQKSYNKCPKYLTPILKCKN